MKVVRTVIVDDHALVGAGIEAVLAERSDGRFVVVGATTRAAEAARLVVDAEAELALVDLYMPAPGGIAAIREILAAAPQTKVVAVSGEADRATIVEALAAGASAFLPKTLGPEGLVAPLATVVDGGGVVPAPLLMALADAWLQSRHVGGRPELDAEDHDLLALVCAGRELAAVADELHVSPSTIKRRLAALEERLGASSRVETAFLAGWYRLAPGPRGADRSG
jgi:two-component system, NarL family, nitrate/nitrite response regulator NarL